MRLGKLKPSVMNRSVLRQLHRLKDRPAGGALSGLSDGLPEERLSGDAQLMSMHTVQGRTLAGKRSLDGAAGKMIEAGGIPEIAGFSILLPEETEEPDLKALIRELSEECSFLNLSVGSCDVAVSRNVRCPVVTVSCRGRAFAPENSAFSKPAEAGTAKDPDGRAEDPMASLDLVAAGFAAAEGTSLLAVEQREKLLTRYPDFFIDEAAGLFRPDVCRVLMKILSQGVSEPGYRYQYMKFQYPGEGGIFAGLWQLAAAARVGLEIELSRIPVKQHTIEVCEFFDRNPYQLFSGGSMLIACENGGRLAGRLKEEGIEARVIGRTTGGNDRIIRYDDEIRYLEPPKVDEYYYTEPAERARGLM